MQQCQHMIEYLGFLGSDKENPVAAAGNDLFENKFRYAQKRAELYHGKDDSI